jgi:hypothetical protein
MKTWLKVQDDRLGNAITLSDLLNSDNVIFSPVAGRSVTKESR